MGEIKCRGALNPKLATLLNVTEKYVKVRHTIWCAQNGPRTDCGAMDTVNKRHISNIAEMAIWRLHASYLKLLVTVASFNRALLLWCAFGLNVKKMSSLVSLWNLLVKKVEEAFLKKCAKRQ